ncbi:hypothetical protein EMIT079MI2_20411 [Bacillus sp. IT-79MI2]
MLHKKAIAYAIAFFLWNSESVSKQNANRSFNQYHWLKFHFLSHLILPLNLEIGAHSTKEQVKSSMFPKVERNSILCIVSLILIFI